jgi:hypothetical protein
VWAYGLRNDFRFNFKPGTDDILSGDVGWDAWEEINVITAGANLGWPCYEGSFEQPGYAAFAQCQTLYGTGGTTFGIHTWDHAAGTMPRLVARSARCVVDAGEHVQGAVSEQLLVRRLFARRSAR